MSKRNVQRKSKAQSGKCMTLIFLVEGEKILTFSHLSFI